MSKEIQKSEQKGIVGLINKSIQELGKACPKHLNPERIARIALTVLRTNTKLMECNPNSFLAALFQSAQLGLEPNTDGQSWLIPYGKEVQFQIGYKGYITLFYRHEMASSINWGIVCDNDIFDFDLGSNMLIHKYDLKKDRGEVYAYWAKANLNNGGSIIAIMSKKEVEGHRKKYCKFSDGKNSPWQTAYDSMALKTVVFKLAKLMPKSAELSQAIEMDNSIKTKTAINMLDVPNEFKISGDDEEKTKAPKSKSKEETPKQDEALEPEFLDEDQDWDV